MTVPIADIIQLIGQHSADEYKAYLEQCKIEYEESRGSANFQERHRRLEVRDAAEALLNLRYVLPTPNFSHYLDDNPQTPLRGEDE